MAKWQVTMIVEDISEETYEDSEMKEPHQTTGLDIQGFIEEAIYDHGNLEIVDDTLKVVQM